MNELADLALIGNCTIGALIDGIGRVVWACFPRFDGDPTFCRLLREDDELGVFGIEVADFERAEQYYLENTAILVTRLYDRQGGCVEITDFAPRFGQYGRMFRPMMLARLVKRIAGSPRLTLRIRPACEHGASRPEVTCGSHHVRYVMSDLTLRLTTNASITAIRQETPFFLEDSITLLLGPDETVPDSADEVGRRFLDETTQYWREWVRFLGIPYEWQAAVIRASITLKLNAYDDTGAIVAAMTTSLPEAADSGRNWDYRFCWLRDGYFVVNALNRVGATRSMERYLSYIVNIAANAAGQPLQPVYRIDGRADLEERIEPAMPSSPPSTAMPWMPARCCSRNWISSRPPTRALPPRSPLSRRICCAATIFSATSRKMILASPKTRFWSAPSGTSMRSPPSAGATRHARYLRNCSPAATATACSPSTSTPARANSGEISCRPTAWLA
jgi:GH15 family glucan-1,4-alpha-glucosidase